jgi:hypothetical protein
VTQQLIEQICQEVILALRNQTLETPSLLRSQLILQFQSTYQSDSKIANYRFILISIKEQLRSILKTNNPVNWEQLLTQVFSLIPQPSLK